jgi:predicted Zn-dependent protease
MKSLRGLLTSGTGILMLTAILVACSSVPVTGRKQLRLVSAGEEAQLGLSSFDQMKKETPISHDAAANAMVQRVGQRLASVASKDLPDAQWEFVVFDSPEANAFCLPGGKVGVYKGILPITKDEAGLATVLGHEIAHAAAHHGAERMSEQMVLQTGGSVVGGLTASDPRMQSLATTAFGLGGQLGRTLPHSRKQESEADHIGLIYMAKAGYNPQEAVNFWQRFSAYNQQKGGGNTVWFLSTHPVDSARISALQGEMQEAMRYYSPGTAVGGTGSGSVTVPSGVISRPR